MNTSEALATLYSLINRRFGKNQAQEAVNIAVSTVMYEMKYEGLEFTAEEFDKRIYLHVSDYLEAANESAA